MNATCLNCKRTFETTRTDSCFCSDPCRAANHRNQGATGKHETLEKHGSDHCHWCSNLFWFNDYADRGGTRQPLYCKASCRQAAWRERVKDKQPPKESQQAPPKRKKVEFEHDATPKQAPPQTKHREQAEYDFRDGLVVPRRWNERDALTWLFGSSQTRSIFEINNKGRLLNKKYHPDVSTWEVYKYLPTINAAWDYLKRINRPR